jgi:hypothetical protein
LLLKKDPVSRNKEVISDIGLIRHRLAQMSSLCKFASVGYVTGPHKIQNVINFYTDNSESLFLSVGRWSVDRESDGRGFTVLMMMMMMMMMMILNHTASLNNRNVRFYVITVELCFKMALMNCHSFWFT